MGTDERRRDYVDIAIIQHQIGAILDVLNEMKEEKKEYRTEMSKRFDNFESNLSKISSKVAVLELAKSKLLGVSTGVSITCAGLITMLSDKFVKFFH